METMIQEIANVGFTLLVFVIGIMIVKSLTNKGDKQMVNLTCKVCESTTIACDEDVVSVTCSDCVNESIMEMNYLEVAQYD